MLLLSLSVSAQYSGWYDNTTVIGNAASENYALDWYSKNRVSQLTETITMYNMPVTKAGFAAFVKKAYQRNFRIIIPYTADSEVDKVLAYNKAQTDPQCKVFGMATEFEPYNYDPKPAGRTWLDAHQGDSIFIRLVTVNAPKLTAVGLIHQVYMGWHNDSLYKYIVKYSVGINLTYYRPSNVISGGDALGYMCGQTEAQTSVRSKWGRIVKVAEECDKQHKPIYINILGSVETTYGFAYYQTHTWNSVYNAFLPLYNVRATPRMKNWIILGNLYFFVSRDGYKCKP